MLRKPDFLYMTHSGLGVLINPSTVHAPFIKVVMEG